MKNKLTMKEQDIIGVRRSLELLIERIDIILGDNGQKPFEKMNIYEKEDYIINGLCNFWGIQKRDLLKKNNSLASRRGYAAILLRDYANMGQEEIGGCLGYSNHSSVTKLLTNMDQKLSEEFWGDSRMRAVYKNIVKYLNLPNG